MIVFNPSFRKCFWKITLPLQNVYESNLQFLNAFMTALCFLLLCFKIIILKPAESEKSYT